MSEEVVSMELPAPAGWKKQYFPKRGGTPRKNEIVFTAPSGEEIHNQRQLQQYLKAHPDGPPPSEFDWGTGETPRRSARISVKAKAVSPTAESDPPMKRARSSSASKKDSKDKEETKAGEVEMKDADKSEEEKTQHGDENDAQMEESDEGKEKGPDSVKEVAKEKPEDSVSLDAKSEKDTSVPQDEGKKEGEDKEATKIDGGGVIPSGHETDPIQMEQPLSDAVKKDSLEEAKVDFDGGEKDDVTDPGILSIQEPKGETNTKTVEVAENGTQAG